MTTPKKNPAAVELGRKGGQSKSPAKLAACREGVKKALAVRMANAAARALIRPA